MINLYDWSSPEKAIDNIVTESIIQGAKLKTQQAYILATIKWETNNKFMAIKEKYWLPEEWRKEKPLLLSVLWARACSNYMG